MRMSSSPLRYADARAMQSRSRKLFAIPAGVLSCLLAINGLAAVRGLDFRQNTLLSAAYCALPLLSLPIYLLALVARRLLLLQALLVLAYIPVYSALNWRTCAELGYCGSIASVVLMTITTTKVLLFWGVGLCSVAAWVMEQRVPVVGKMKRKH
jgi:hypothetical protein